MIATVASARVEADPDASESPNVASVHDGMMLGGSFGIGVQLHTDLRVGWMLSPRAAVFATGLWGKAVGDNSSRRLFGVGARLWITDRAFLEGRLGQGIVRSGASSGDANMESPGAARMETKGEGGLAGLGVEMLHSRHFGLELHAEGIYTAGEGAVTVGLGITFY